MCCADECQVGQALGEVAEEVSGGGVDFFGEQADVVAVGQHGFEDGVGLFGLAGVG